MSLGNNNIEINNMEYKIFEVNNYSNTFFDKKQEKWSVLNASQQCMESPSLK